MVTLKASYTNQWDTIVTHHPAPTIAQIVEALKASSAVVESFIC